MHEVHIYEGVVLAKRAIREADALVDVLTPAGLVRARALGARKEASKLRYGLEPLSRGRYSFVHGREWRLTGATDTSRALVGAPAPARAAAARVARLLLRLVAAEEPSPELFSTVSEGFDLLAARQTSFEKSSGLLSGPPEAARLGRPDFSQESAASLEIVLVLRILSKLGYLPHSEALAPFVEGRFSVELSARALERKALLVRTINESLHASGL